MNVRRVASIGSALVVAGIAAYASYSHMRHLALEYGQDAAVATLLPVSVDGLMVVATLALGDGRRYRWSAWAAFWAGVAASVVANVLAAPPSGIARTISAWPAIAFLLVVEVITRGGRVRAREVDTQEDIEQDTTPDTVAVTSVTSPAKVPPTVSVPVADTTPATPAMPKRTPARTVPATKAATGTATKVAKLRARQPDITQAEAAAKLKVSDRSVRRYWAATEPATTPATGPVNGHEVPDLITT